MKSKISTKTINLQKAFFVFVFSVLTSITSTFATTYYVDNNAGNDLNNGLSTGSPWQTLTKVNAYALLPGDSVKFIRNGVWRGQLLPQSGSATAYIVYTSYGTGNKPLFLGSLNKSSTSDWISVGGNIWRSAMTSTDDIGNLIFNGATSFGWKKWDLSGLLTQGDFWWDKFGTQTVEIYSVGNPATFYSDIEVAIGKFMIYPVGDSCIIFEDLALKYGSGSAFEVRNSHHIIIRACDISYTGGSETGFQVRYGGGIQFWASSNNNTVERCKIWEIYDEAVTNQNNNSGGVCQQYNIYYRNNLIWNCSYASVTIFVHAFGSASLLKNIYFENNTCVNAGGGWSWAQRPDHFLQSGAGSHVRLGNISATADSIFIRNNIFYKSKCVLFCDNSSGPIFPYLYTDYNCWYTQNNTDTIVALWTPTSAALWTKSQFGNYQTTNNKDLNSFMADPMFLDPGMNDFRLTASSPCINTGTNTGITHDFDLTSVPQNILYDIGAYEWVTNTGIENNNPNLINIKLYPNPVTDMLTIEIAGNKNKEQIQILNSTGVLIKELEITQVLQINIVDLPSGLYFIHLKSNPQQVLKFIRQ